MGVTIHFEGRLKEFGSFDRCLEIIKSFIDKNSWENSEISEEVRTLSRVKDEEVWNYTGKTKGVAIQPHPNTDPFKFEIDEDLYLQEYCKTQFAPIEIHVELVGLLKALEVEFENLSVVDEGEYFESGDIDRLSELIDGCYDAMDKEKEKNPKLEGPVRLNSGRIVDLIS